MRGTLLELIAGFEEALNGSATLDQLLSIREKMDSWMFRENVKANLHGINDPNEIARLRDALRQLQRCAEDLASRLTNRRELFRIGGFGGGVGIFGAALVTAVTFAMPAILIIPMLGSIGIVWRSAVHSNQASSEITIIGQIAEIAKELADWKDF